jgi:N-acetyl-gamma-glutamyl-phosphate reductase
MTYTVAVAGASGYAGGEVLRLLAGHPDLEVTTVTASSNAGRPLVELQPHLRSYAHLTLQETTAEVLAGHDVVFLALPHGASGAITAQLPDDVLVVDCGADHRLTDEAAWARFYGGEFNEPWAYGVPELADGAGKLRERLAGAKKIAAPGCNASSVALAIAPGFTAGLIEEDVVAVLAVGPSGAGKNLKVPYLAAELLGSANPYGVGGGHRHIPEIVQSLKLAGATEPKVSFTPVLVPMARGILATVTAPLKPGVTPAQVRAAWQQAYEGEAFVQLLPEGVWPRTADVLGANTALIGVTVDEAANRVVALIAVDNLVKGTAGAAIQSANIALGLPEGTALTTNGVAP